MLILIPTVGRTEYPGAAQAAYNDGVALIRRGDVDGAIAIRCHRRPVVVPLNVKSHGAVALGQKSLGPASQTTIEVDYQGLYCHTNW